MEFIYHTIQLIFVEICYPYGVLQGKYLKCPILQIYDRLFNFILLQVIYSYYFRVIIVQRHCQLALTRHFVLSLKQVTYKDIEMSATNWCVRQFYNSKRNCGNQNYTCNWFKSNFTLKSGCALCILWVQLQKPWNSFL